MSNINLSKESFTCITCRVAFKDADLQRQHYKTDWHRYNLKRKVAELPPVTSEEFQRRVLLQRKESDNLQNIKSIYCNPCRKSFGNQKAYDNHLNSKKHKEKSFETDNTTTSNTSNKHILGNKQNEDYETDSEIEEVDSDEWDDEIENPINNDDCLFCGHHSRSLLTNVKHMSVEHSFFIPDVEYCVDIKGLLVYLGEKINCGKLYLIFETFKKMTIENHSTIS